MKINKQNSLLMGITAFCVVISLILCGVVLQAAHVIRAAQVTQAQGVELQREILRRQMFFNEINEYAKRNPDILRLLPNASSAPAATKPATK